jgi:hypothetical protein
MIPQYTGLKIRVPPMSTAKPVQRQKSPPVRSSQDAVETKADAPRAQPAKGKSGKKEKDPEILAVKSVLRLLGAPCLHAPRWTTEYTNAVLDALKNDEYKRETLWPTRAGKGTGARHMTVYRQLAEEVFADDPVHRISFSKCSALKPSDRYANSVKNRIDV